MQRRGGARDSWFGMLERSSSGPEGVERVDSVSGGPILRHWGDGGQ